MKEAEFSDRKVDLGKHEAEREREIMFFLGPLLILLLRPYVRFPCGYLPCVRPWAKFHYTVLPLLLPDLIWNMLYLHFYGR